jgi:hypothetical protein
MELVAKSGIDTYHDRERFVNECGRNSNTPTQANYQNPPKTQNTQKSKKHPKTRKNPQKV